MFVLIAVLEICSDKNNRESVVETFKNIEEGILGKIDKNLCHAQQILGIKGVGGLGESVKKGKFATKIFFK